MDRSARRGSLRIFWVRRLVQLAVLGAVVYLALGFGKRTFEAFCPFGGAEAMWSLVSRKAYTCTLSEMNLAMFLAVLGLTLAAGKVFCGWICPIGLLNEWLSRLGRRLPGVRRVEISPRADRALRYLRYPLLVLILALTWRAGELILRGYDPFFLLFSGFGHGAVGWISVAALAVTVLGALFAPMLWCRYACPLGAVMDVLARFGMVRIHRDAAACTSCGLCDTACLQRCDVSGSDSLAAVDCTRCWDCVDACGHNALSLRVGAPDPRAARRSWTKATAWALPVLALAALFAGVRAATPLTLPTASAAVAAEGPGAVRARATCTVQGVKCLGTANFFIRRIGTVPGVLSVDAYAGTHRVVLAFDRTRLSPEALRDSIDAPIRHPVTGELFESVFVCTEMQVDD